MESKNAQGTSSSKYDCPYCHKRFDRPSSVKIHITSHTGEKPYICAFPGCGRRFSVNSNMRRHLRTHTPHTNNSMQDMPEVEDDEPPHTAATSQSGPSRRSPVQQRRAAPIPSAAAPPPPHNPQSYQQHGSFPPMQSSPYPQGQYQMLPPPSVAFGPPTPSVPTHPMSRSPLPHPHRPVASQHHSASGVGSMPTSYPSSGPPPYGAYPPQPIAGYVAGTTSSPETDRWQAHSQHQGRRKPD